MTPACLAAAVSAYGICYSGNLPYNVRVKEVSVTGSVILWNCPGCTDNSTVVESCTVNVAGSYGIYADSVSDSTALNCGYAGFFADTANNCKASAIGGGSGLSATTANNCSGISSGNGFRVVYDWSGDGLLRLQFQRHRIECGHCQ